MKEGKQENQFADLQKKAGKVGWCVTESEHWNDTSSWEHDKLWLNIPLTLSSFSSPAVQFIVVSTLHHGLLQMYSRSEDILPSAEVTILFLKSLSLWVLHFFSQPACIFLSRHVCNYPPFVRTVDSRLTEQPFSDIDSNILEQKFYTGFILARNHPGSSWIIQCEMLTLYEAVWGFNCVCTVPMQYPLRRGLSSLEWPARPFLYCCLG